MFRSFYTFCIFAPVFMLVCFPFTGFFWYRSIRRDMRRRRRQYNKLVKEKARWEKRVAARLERKKARQDGLTSEKLGDNI